MVPSIETRLRSIAKAIEQVIIPVIPVDQRLAIEQAEIAIAHLKVLDTQWRYVTATARLELGYLVELAQELSASRAGVEDGSLATLLDAARSVDPGDFDALRSAAQKLGEAVERFIESADGLMSDRTLRSAVVKHARFQARLERSWFAAAGIADAQGVPKLADLIASEIASDAVVFRMNSAT